MACVVPIEGPVPVMTPLTPAQANAPAADENRRSLRRQRTASRFHGLALEIRALAFEFRPFRRPQARFSVAATLLVCTLLQLLVGAPYAANERAADSTPTLRAALRGLIVGILVYFVVGPIFLVNAPTVDSLCAEASTRDSYARSRSRWV